MNYYRLILQDNEISILTMEDDHSRKLWVARLDNETDDSVVERGDETSSYPRIWFSFD